MLHWIVSRIPSEILSYYLTHCSVAVKQNSEKSGHRSAACLYMKQSTHSFSHSMCNVQSWKQCALWTAFTGKSRPECSAFTHSSLNTFYVEAEWSRRGWHLWQSNAGTTTAHTTPQGRRTRQPSCAAHDLTTSPSTEFFIAVTCRPETNPMPVPLREPFQEEWYHMERTLNDCPSRKRI